MINNDFIDKSQDQKYFPKSINAIGRKNVDIQNKDSARRTAIYFSSLLRF